MGVLYRWKWRNASPVIAEENQGKAVLAINVVARRFSHPSLLTRLKCISFKSGGKAFKRTLFYSVALIIMA